jgi:hypothetical protein
MRKKTAVLKNVWSGPKGTGHKVYVGVLPHSVLKTIKKSTDKFLEDNGIEAVYKSVRVHIGWARKHPGAATRKVRVTITVVVVVTDDEIDIFVWIDEANSVQNKGWE